MKKKWSLLLAGIMVLSVTACGGQPASPSPSPAEAPAAEEASQAESGDVTEKEEETSEAAGKEDTGDAGRYVLYEYTGNGTTVDHDLLAQAGMGDTYLELNADGKGKFMLFETEMDITWKKGSIKVYGTTEYTYELDGDKLVLDMAGVKYTFVKEGTALAQAAPETGEPEAEPEPEAGTEAAGTTASGDISTGDGIVTEEAVQKGYVWMSKVNKDIFNTTYEDLVAYFGVEGAFDKEEYSDHMKQNKRYYKWISEEDPNHFVYVNFAEKDAEKEPGVYKISGFNSSGFDAAAAESQYLAELESAASAAGKEEAANAKMKTQTMDIYTFASKDNPLKVSFDMPESGWSLADRSGEIKLVENEDPDSFGAGFINVTMEEDVEKFDFYKDDFENYKEIGDRVIGGVTMKGRTYKNIGYDWTEYIAQVSDGKAVSVGIVDVDISEGSMGDKILNSITFK